MAGLSRAHGDFRSLGVADFADENNVRIVPQHGTQSAGKSQPDIGPHLNLGDAFQLIFHRIFDGDDFARLIIGVRQRGIQRQLRCPAAAAAGRSRDRASVPAAAGDAEAAVAAGSHVAHRYSLAQVIRR